MMTIKMVDMEHTSGIYRNVVEDIKKRMESREETIPITPGTGYTLAITSILSECPDKQYAIMVHASYMSYWSEVLGDIKNVELISIRKFNECVRDNPDKEWDMIVVDSSPRMAYGLNSYVRKSLLKHTDYLCELKTFDQIVKDGGQK